MRLCKSFRTISCRGFSIKFFGESIRMTVPERITAIRSPSSRASSGSCKTQIIVTPVILTASFKLVFTSVLVASSTLLKGSSSNSKRGSMAKALASATRCFCPQLSSLGFRHSNPSNPTKESLAFALDSISPRLNPLTLKPKATLSYVVRCGKRPKSCGTYPIFLSLI